MDFDMAILLNLVASFFLFLLVEALFRPVAICRTCVTGAWSESPA